MNQDQDRKMRNQGKQGGQSQAGQTASHGDKPQPGQPHMNQRGNPSTTERIQPEPNRGGGQRQQEGEKPTGNPQPKF